MKRSILTLITGIVFLIVLVTYIIVFTTHGSGNDAQELELFVTKNKLTF